MRIGAKPDGVVERLGLVLNRVPVPIGESMFGMAVARSLQVAQTTGMLAALAERPHTAAELAERLGLREEGTERLLDVLAAQGHVRLAAGERYEMTSRARRWLDPDSDRYVGGFLADTHHYWAWWDRLEDLVRDGKAVELHDREPDDPYWRSYIQGQYEIARLSSDEVAKGVDLAPGATSLLDVAGGHGEFSMALCRRHQDLRATIVDLPGSAAVGREIVARAGMSDRVTYVEGDMFEADLGSPHDGALCFNIVHHLSPERAKELFSRIRKPLRPGAPLCVLDLYDRPEGEEPDSAALLGLFFHLTSGADTYSVPEVSEWMAGSGFHAPKAIRFRTLPSLALLRAEAV
jgi:2-polyprenyl-3-methyl-5-hydroxy-6-metoxy-1,4-benzoquinol methylase